MTSSYIAHLRLLNQHISRATFETPGQVVAWLGAVQAQDYLGALWAVGLRMRQATEATIEHALAERTIIRTWPMRGTLHFVAVADVRWMLELLTPRIVASSAWRLQQLGVDDAILARSSDVFVRTLQGGKQLSRDALYQVLEAAGIATGGGRGLQIVGRLAQDGVICFGAREGKQQTFALLDEWAPEARSMERDAALTELARRYFTSHGPATVQDFAWWSGLTITDARVGLELAKPHLVHEVIDGQTYWLAAPLASTPHEAPAAYLLPAYDEYTVSYKDRSAVLSALHAKLEHAGNGIFNPTLVVDGQIVGTWKRTLRKDAVVIMPHPFAALNDAETRAIAAAAQPYGAFLGVPVVLS